MLNVQKYLLTHSLDDLAKEHGVYAKIDGHKFSLTYDQIEAKNNDPIACECRGLILRRSVMRVDRKTGLNLIEDLNSTVVGPTTILCHGMDRFFNLGQESATKVDFEHPDTCYLDKLDGTMILVYYDDIKKEWCCATRSIPEANLFVDGFQEYTFRSLFEKAFKETSGGKIFPETFEKVNQRKDLNFVFELMTPYNQVVVRHDTFKVALITIRSLDTINVGGQELDYNSVKEIAKALNVPVVPRHTIRNVKDLVEFVNSRNGMEFEGCVVCDRNFNRVKVKNPGYLAAHRVKSLVGSSPRNLLELILLGQLDDTLPILTEEHQKMATEMQENLRKYCQSFDKIWAELYEVVPKHLSDRVRRKEFAISVQVAQVWMAPMMAIYEGKAENISQWLSKQAKNEQYADTFLDKLLVEISK